MRRTLIAASLLALAALTGRAHAQSGVGNAPGAGFVPVSAAAGPGTGVWSTTFPAPMTFTASVISNPTGNTPAWASNQTITGSNIAGGSLNNYFITDSVNQTSPTILYIFDFAANIGGSSMSGARTIMQASINLTAPTNASNPNRNYVAFNPTALANSSDNGTAGVPAGALFAMNPIAFANNGATNLFAVTPQENDFGLRTGSSAQYLFGHSIVHQGNVHATLTANTQEAYLAIYNGGTIALNNGILFGLQAGAYPVAATGTVINNTQERSGRSSMDRCLPSIILR